jgi:hypothetical protein
MYIALLYGYVRRVINIYYIYIYIYTHIYIYIACFAWVMLLYLSKVSPHWLFRKEVLFTSFIFDFNITSQIFTHFNIAHCDTIYIYNLYTGCSSMNNTIIGVRTKSTLIFSRYKVQIISSQIHFQMFSNIYSSSLFSYSLYYSLRYSLHLHNAN